MSEQYFANLESEELLRELKKREDSWFRHIEDFGIRDLHERAYRAYYSENRTTRRGRIADVGPQGEFKSMISNQLRNLVQHTLTLTTQSRLNFQPRAINSDHKSLAQAIMAKGLLEFYVKERKMEGSINETTEYGLMVGEGFIKLDWDPELGEQIFENNFNGDVKNRVLPGVNVVRDPKKTSHRKNQWFILRDKRNKFDLIAQYPEMAEKIEALKDFYQDENNTIFDDIFLDMDSDDVYIREFWHEKTPACPQGRLVIYADNDVLLYDGPLPYEKIHLYRLAPSSWLGTPHGYSIIFDLLPLQEAYDALNNAILTNQTTFAIPIIGVQNGDGFDYEDFSSLRILRYNKTPPAPLNFTATAGQTFEYLAGIKQEMEEISAINAVLRGKVPDGVTAGNALALIQAQAVQFNSNLQREYANLAEDVATATIDLLKQFGDAPRTAFITGKNGRGYVKSFNKDDLMNVSRVVVEVANPITATYQGRKNISDEWLTKGLITPREQLLFIHTGNEDVLIELDELELMLIKQENEFLSEGKQVMATAVESHLEHIKEHKGVLFSLEAKQDPDTVKAVMDHIYQHIDLLRQTDPQLLQALGQPSLAPPPMPAGPVGPPPPVEANNPQGPVPNGPQPPLPKPPVNPATGEPAEMATPVIPKG